MAAVGQSSRDMNGTETVITLAGRGLRIEATSERARAAVAPALAHLTNAAGVAGGQTRWMVVEEDACWRPRAFPAAGAYRERSGGFAAVQSDPASFESYHPEIGIELRATAAAFAAGDLRAHPACHA